MIKILLFIGLHFCIAAVRAQKSPLFVIEVQSEKVPCSGYEGQNECYVIRFNEGAFELSYEYIDNFNFTPGYHYKLLVVSDSASSGVPDMPERVLKVIEVLEAVKQQQH